jgi:hypothetical protein
MSPPSRYPLHGIDRCPTTTALLHSSKSTVYEPPPTYQVPLRWRETPVSGDFLNISSRVPSEGAHPWCPLHDAFKMYGPKIKEVTGRYLLMSFVMQWMAVLGIFTVHRQQLISTSGMPVQLLRVIRTAPSKGTFH